MSKKKVTASVLSTLGVLAGNKQIQRMLFGEYTNGKIRSLADAWNGEILSPEDKKKKVYKKRKAGKKKIKL